MKNNQPKSKGAGQRDLKTIKGNQRAKAPPPPALTKDPAKAHTLFVKVPEGGTADRAYTDLTAAGLASNAAVSVWYTNPTLGGGLSMADMVDSLEASGKAVNSGDMKAAEQMLAAQAVSLNAIFAEMARRAALNMGQYLDATDRYMRMALKAQSQCRTTLETLSTIKNPPVVFAKQANISNGPQQVNNGQQQVVNPATSNESSTRTYARAHGEAQPTSNELMRLEDGTRLDAGTQGAAIGPDTWLATVAAIDRAKVGRGEGAVSPEQHEARRTVG